MLNYSLDFLKYFQWSVLLYLSSTIVCWNSRKKSTSYACVSCRVSLALQWIQQTRNQLDNLGQVADECLCRVSQIDKAFLILQNSHHGMLDTNVYLRKTEKLTDNKCLCDDINDNSVVKRSNSIWIIFFRDVAIPLLTSSFQPPVWLHFQM